MNYANLLSDAVVRSGWTYAQIVEKCGQRGITFSRSYLSKLCTGFMSPPSDQINKALAEVLGPATSITYSDLALAKYKQIVPNEVLEALASGE